MHHRFQIIVSSVLLAALAGCSTSTLDAVKGDPPPMPDSADVQAARPAPIRADSAALSAMRPWTGHFIPTGSACGIMIEFTGIKKNKQLNARYCTVELQRYPIPEIDGDSLQPPASGFSEGLKTLSLTSPINDLRQAFFKVPPGTYLVRQTRDWADRSIVRNVEVRDGNYSIIFIDVFQAWSARARQMSQTPAD